MKNKTLLAGFIFVLISLVFFYPIFSGKVPFPGDLLVGEHAPYDTNTYGGYSAGSIPNKAQGPDVIRQLFPWKHFAVESFKNSQIPFWNPYSLSGNPLMANFQSGVFYPLNAVFLSDFLIGWTFFILLIPILASFFTYLFLRELNVGRVASVFGSIIFAFSSYMVVWMEYGNVGHTFIWLPLGLLFAERLSKNFSIKTAIFLILSLTVAFLAGYIQGYFYIILTLIFYFFLKSKYLKTFTSKKFLSFLLILLVPSLLSAFQLLPTLELFTLSSRNNYTLLEIDKLLNPIWYTITTIIPNFFGHPVSRNHWFYGTYIERVSYFGFIPFIFALFAILNFKKRKEIFIFSAIAFSSLFLATNLFITKFIYSLPLPVISTTVPTRILSLFVFSGCILAAFGLDLYQKNNYKFNGILKVIGVIFILVWAGVMGILEFSKNPEWIHNVSITKNNLILPTLFLIGLGSTIFVNFLLKTKYKKTLPNLVILGIFALTLFDLFYFFHKITPFSPKEYVYPQTEVLQYLKNNSSMNKFWGYGEGSLENNFSTYEKIYSTSGYEPLHIKRYGELISASKNGKIESHLSGSDANIESGYGAVSLMDNKYRKRLLDLLGVRYILNKNKLLGSNYLLDYSIFPKENFKLVWQKSPWQIYENKNVLPRVFLASEYVVEKDRDKIIEKIFDNKINLREKIILEEDIVPKIDLSTDKNAKVEIENYTHNKIVLKTKAATNMLLFISDNYYPGWKVSIDGKNGKIYRADYSFRAVPIAEGKHEVIFSYYSKSFDLGLKISIGSFIAVTLLAILLKFKSSYYVKK